MMDRGQFTFYRSFWDALKDMKEKDRSAVLCAICAYALDGEELPLTGVQRSIFALIRPTLDTSARKAENAKKARAKQEQTGSKPEANRKQTVKEKEKEIENEIEVEKEKEIEIEIEKDIYKEKKEKKEKFPPSIEAVIAYCKERDKGVDPERFYNYYASNGWRVGKNPMKDWRAAVRTWERQGRETGSAAETRKYPSMAKYVQELQKSKAAEGATP